MVINRRTSLPPAFRCARGPHADSLEQYWKFCVVNKSILWCEVCQPLSCCLFFFARSLTRFFAARPFSSFVCTDWETWLCGGERDHSRKQSALITIIFPVSSGFPLESVLVGSPLNKVDLRASPGFYESKGGAVVRALASHQCGPGLNLGVNAICWVEFVVGSPLCSETFFSGFSGFPLSLKTITSKLS